MEIERRPGYDALVGRWDEAQHFHNISKPGYLYLVHDGSESSPVAFVALSGLCHRDGDVVINRMIVRTPGQGIGKTVLSAVMRLAFEGAPTYRLGLRVLPDNLRALHVYRSRGFKDERLLPGGGMLPSGRRVDLLLMSILREDWVERNPE
jgi:hypothetical protein